MMDGADISFVIPTRNSARTIAACAESCRHQRGAAVEVIVVDNSSTDGTAEIAEPIADKVVIAGPERSAQRNRGAREASGEIVVFIDSDMVLSPDIGRQLRDVFSSPAVEAVVIPEIVEGEGFWEKCRSIEKRAYLGDDRIEAARGFRRSTVLEAGGYDESLTGPEDWDLPDRIVAAGGKLDRIEAVIHHDERGLSLWEMFGKKRYYGRSVGELFAREPERAKGRRARPRMLKRFVQEGWRDPVHLGGLFVLKAVEFSGAGLGMLEGRRRVTRG